MAPHKRKLRWLIVGGLLVVCILLWHPCTDAVFAVRLSLGIKKLATGANNPSLAFRQARLHRQMNGAEYEALLYYPQKSAPTTAVIIVAGLSELGCYHPRVIAISHLMADMGLLVITPDIREFRDFQISAKPIDQILFWYRQIPGLKEGEKVKKIGLAGVSFSGTLALMAAARPEIRDSVGFAAAIGPYSSLMRCTKAWFAAAPSSSGKYYPTRFYAKWIIMRSALDMIAEPKERLFLRDVLDDLLLQKKVPPVETGFSAQAIRWYGLAIMPENRTDPELTDEIEKYLVSRIYPQLNPEGALAEIRCPVFLIHGAYDDLISPEESRDLHERLANSHLLISPFLTHTHPTEVRLSFGQRFMAALDTLGFFYGFAQVVR